MTVLRSRELPSIPAKARPQDSEIEPSTPVRTQEPNVQRSTVERTPGLAPDGLDSGYGPTTTTSRRRSLRLACKTDGAECLNGLKEKEVSISVSDGSRSNVDDDLVSVIDEGKRYLSLRSGKRLARRSVENGTYVSEQKDIESNQSDRLESNPVKLNFDTELENYDVEMHLGTSDEKNYGLKLEGQVDTDASSKSGKSVSGSKRKMVCGDFVEDNMVTEKCCEVVNVDTKLESESSILGDTIRRPISEKKGKTVNGIIIGDSLVENHADVKLVENVISDSENRSKGKELLEDLYGDRDVKGKCIESYEKPGSSTSRRKYTREEKGKGICLETVSVPITDDISRVGVEEMEEKNSSNNHEAPDVIETRLSAYVDAGQTKSNNGNELAQKFREIAKENAFKFAYFDAEREEEEELSDKEVEQQVEDWPGPFSTAMKIIKDREEKVNMRIGAFESKKERSSPRIWTPKRNHGFVLRKAPSLEELSMRYLVRNADAITSLDYVPDTLRRKLCRLLCDSRRMDIHFLHLLFSGSPTEISVPDCSWLTEEQFTECFKDCDTSNLTVLQLDMCGRCMPDYVLHSTLAKSPNNLPLLSSLSLNGACRLSDVGLQALVSAAPAIRSINLSQCSLLTSSSINMLSDLLGPVLRELYINDCQNIDLKLILPALKKFENLEVLSLADLPSVRGRSLREFVTVRGQSLKQLILANSVKLTDSSIKAISENCPNLSVLDLANICKLTDSSLGYLANGCRALEKLMFCRNSFSDEAVAAFLETAGRYLEELSLNNVKKVSHNTALALGKHSKNLQTLDVSWCRNMSDDALGYIVDNCSSLKLVKLFGCTQITDVFVEGHSNVDVKIIGLKMTPFLDK